MKNLIKADFYCLSKSSIYKALFVFEILYAIRVAIGIKNWAGAYCAFCAGCCLAMHHGSVGMIFAADFFCGENKGNTWANKLLSGDSRNKVIAAKYVVFFVGMSALIMTFTVCMTVVMCMIKGVESPFTKGVAAKLSVTFILSVIGWMTECLVLAACAVCAKKPVRMIFLAYLVIYPFEWLKNNCEFMRYGDVIEAIIKYSYLYQMSTLHYKNGLKRALDFVPSRYLSVMLVTMGIAGVFIYKRFRDTEF